MSERIKSAMSFFTSKGWEPHQAAGIVGNLMAESGLNSRVKPGDSGTAFGVAQWRGQRLSGLKQFASSNGADWQDFNTQLAYVDYELRTTEKSAGDRIRSAKNVQQAHEGMITYERPQGSNKGVQYAHNYSGRLKFSNQAMGLSGGEAQTSSYTPNDKPPVGTDRAPMAYDAYSHGAPDRPDIYTQNQRKLDNGQKPYGSFFEEVGASYKSNSFTDSMVRWASEDSYDPLYVMPLEQREQIVKSYPEQYHDFLLFAGSERNLTTRTQWVDEDVVRQQRLAEGGWSATAAGFTAGIIDPVPFAAGVATGGLSVAARGAGLGARIATGAAYGSASNLALDTTASYVFDDPHANPMMAAGVGAVFGAFGGAIARAGHVDDANAILSEGTRLSLNEERMAKQAVPSAEPVGSIISGQGNLSAARNTQMKDSLIGETNAHSIMLRDESVPTAVGGGLRFDVAGQMTTSKNPLVRQAGYTFFEETVGTKAHDVIPDSVNSKFTANYRQAMYDFNGEYQAAKSKFIKESDVSGLNLLGKARKGDEFNRLVSEYVANPTSSKASTSPAVAEAGEAFKRNMQNVSRQLREAGFDIPENANYVPLMARHDKIAELDNVLDAGTVQKFIYHAIKEHSPDIDKTLAEKMAKGYWLNLRKAGYGIEDEASKAIHLGDREAFKKSFGEKLEDGTMISPEDLDKAYDIMSGMVDATKKTSDGSKGMSRLKKRTLLDYNFKAKVLDRQGNEMELSMRDFFEDDAELLMGTYLRKMLPRIEFAKARIENPDTGEVLINGFKSEADISKLKDMIRESSRKMSGNVHKNMKDAEKAVQNVDFAWKRINGIPVWDQSGAAAQWARRIKDSQFVRLMSNMGLNQVQESWKLISMTGFRASMQQLPAIRTMVQNVRSGSVKANQLIEELSSMTGLGTEYLFNRNSLKVDDARFGAGPMSKFERTVDGALDVSKQVTSQLSLMRTIMDYQQRWAMGAVTQQMANMARKARLADGTYDLSKIAKMDRARLATLGMADDDLKLLFKNLSEHSEFHGKKIIGANLPKWDAEAVSKYRYFLGRYTDRLVQANDFGGLSKWMSHPVASMFIQFRPFVLGAWAKSTLHAYNHGAFSDPKMITLLLGEWAMGTATFALRQSHQLTTDEGEQKFWEETMDPVNLMKNGWARTASASVLPMFLDSLLSFTPAGPQFGNARSSGTATDAWFGSPVTDQLKSAQQFSSGAMSSLWNGEEMSGKDIRAGVRAFAPWGNWVPFTAAMNSLLKDR